MPNDNALTADARATIMDACQSISRSADALKDCHTVDGDWGDDLDAKALYDAELELLGRLTALLDSPSQPEPRAEVTDTDRLNWLRDEACDLRCIDMPTGAGDSEVRWIVVQHHMSKPHEREIGRSTTEEPREAIDAALTGASS
ncbi:hypothetical protein [Burkholderia vietnamiensis]|uniref:hypothetical protein n=1 Tax=Burkholderia vietnamiensis TaxID=60552 RepID=UPI001D14449E|nr:hypothetical protein [Burkholderia vietnamiensis]UEC03930.1 hypothetical protein LK462_32095 [Burkholderia vietnamiensis]